MNREESGTWMPALGRHSPVTPTSKATDLELALSAILRHLSHRQDCPKAVVWRIR
jgi:hypothetical protein